MTTIKPAGDNALIIDEADLASTMRRHAALRERLDAGGLRGVTELIPAARTILVTFRADRTNAEALRAELEAIEGVERAASAVSPVVIPVTYDGGDLAEVAELLGVSTDELVRRHLAADWRVAFTGYAPGFGYLVGDDPLFDTPRRASPRTRIPAGSVGLAGNFSGVYPRESPGGWQLIGRTNAVMWDLHRDPPALFQPGARVSFTRAERDKIVVPEAARADAAVGEHALSVVRPGMQLTLQDLGRAGHAALGVSESGTADRAALRRANRAVGNAPGAGALEIAGGGTVLRVSRPGVIAFAGADADVQIVRTDGVALPVVPGIPAATVDGDEIRVGAFARGLRIVLAVRGGFDIPGALGSISQDTLAGLGPDGYGATGLAAGDVLPCHGPAAAPFAVRPDPAPHGAALPTSGDEVELRIVLGPRDDWFTASALDVLTTQPWQVTPRSDRVGVRLHGETPLERAREGELASEGAVTGSIQVPPDGQPVLFLPDHPLTGGYPIVAAVIDADLDLAGQLPPGCRIRFRAVSAAESEGA